MNKTSKVLVTGAAGFIGSHLVEYLVAEGKRVISFVKYQNDIDFFKKIDTEIVYGDLEDYNSLKRATQGIEEVYHLAAIPNLQKDISHEKYQKINVEGTQKVLQACIENHVNKFLFTSSLEAVGPSKDGKPVDERTFPNPANIYGVTKLKAEEIVNSFCERENIKTVIVRLPMVYGPRNKLQFKRYFRVPLYGFYPVLQHGNSLVEFCYVKNAVLGLKIAMEKGVSGATYFISDQRSYKFREIINAIAKELKVNVTFINLPVLLARGLGFSCEILSKVFNCAPFTLKETGRPMFSRNAVRWMSQSILFCDTSKAKRELGYKTYYNLEEGVKETINWYKSVGLL